MTRNPVTAYAESRLQEAICSYLRHALPPTYRFFAVPNGAHMSEATAKHMKRIGMTAGVPDLVFVRQGGWIGFLEVKADKGKLSEAQSEFSTWCGENSVPWAIVRSIDDVEATLRAWNVPLRGRVAA